MGGPIASNDNLPVRVVESVESVEKPLLDSVLAADKLDVVNEENINRAIPISKLRCFLCLDCCDEFVSKLLRAGIEVSKTPLS
jgi:hypothetical protein